MSNNSRQKMKRLTSCPKCGSKDLLDLAPDQFCHDCDWDTCFRYVQLGLMDHLEASDRDHSGSSNRDSHSKDAQLSIDGLGRTA
jgi:hypothetical protein